MILVEIFTNGELKKKEMKKCRLLLQLARKFLNSKKDTNIMHSWQNLANVNQCNNLVYSWGNIENKGAVIYTQPKPHMQDSKNITGFSCGNNHTMAVDSEGTVYALGSN